MLTVPEWDLDLPWPLCTRTMREILGSGSFFGYKFIEVDGILVFILAPGEIHCFGYLIAVVNKINKAKKA